MGWTASTTPKYTNLGEIPGLRELSDKERAILEKNDPNDGLHSIRKNLKKRDAAVAEKLLEDYGQLAMDIGNYIDDWIGSPDANSPVFNILSPTLFDDIKEQLFVTGDSYKADDVYDIACRQLQPMMFYFGVNIDAKTNDVYIVVTRRDYWDDNKTLDDSGISDYVIPDFLTKPQDSRYEIKEDYSPSKAKREMIKQGFIEKQEVAGL